MGTVVGTADILLGLCGLWLPLDDLKLRTLSSSTGAFVVVGVPVGVSVGLTVGFTLGWLDGFFVLLEGLCEGLYDGLCEGL